MTAIQVGVRRPFRPAFGRFVLFALCAAGVALPAAAVTHHVDVLLDLDNDPATGCMVSTSEGPFAGAEEILRSVVETTALPTPAATVTEVLRLSCAGGAIFDPPVVVDDGDWPVGVGFGVGGSNVIETYVPSDQLPADLDTIRLAVVLSAENGDDTALLFTSPGSGQPILFVLAQAIAEIPTLSQWGLMLLAVLLAALAAHRLRRRAVVAALAVLLVLGAAGVAWAAVLLDGDPSDWTGASELASDPPVGPCFGLHIASLHAKPGAGQLCFRVDACLLFNEPPVAADDAVATDEDVPVAGNVLVNDSDPDGDPLTVETTPITPPANGVLVLAANGDFTYTPNLNFNGVDSFVYRIGDGNGGTDTATVTITVTAVNDAPVANAQAVSTDEDTPLLITLTASDADGDALGFVIATGPANGSLSPITPIDATSAQVTYTPNGDFVGADSFTFTATDGTVVSPAATVSITVDPVNDAPVADAQAVSTDEDVPLVITLTGSDTDSDPLTFAIATGPTNGSLSAITPIDATSAQVTYTPNGDFNGADSFTFTANDGTATSPAATVSITVDAVNDVPVANAQAVATDEDTPLVVTLTGSDADGDGLTFAIASGPVNGVLSAITPVDATSAQVTYTPGADFVGADSFTFTVDDGTATSPAATVSITVNPVNDPAVVDLDADDSEGTGGVDFAFTYTESTGPQPLLDPADATITDIDSTTLSSVTLTLTNLLDAGEEVLAASAAGFPNITVQPFDTTTTPGEGVLVISAAVPQPIADFVAVLRTATYEHTGDDPDTTARVTQVTANDGGGDGPAAISTATITAVNDAPVADPQAVSTDEDTPLVITLTGSDAEGDPLTFAIATGPTSGSLSAITPVDATSAQVTYTPNADFNGADSFTFTVDDGTTTSPAATVSITVDAVNDAPVANAQAVATDEDTPLVVTLTGSDVDGDPLTFAIATGPTNGSLSAITPVDATSAQVTYTPNADFNGADSFTFTANDGTASSPAATVSITVNAVNDAPVANPQAVATDEDTPLVVTLTGSDTDGDPLTFAIATGPASGSLSAITPVDATSAQVTYTPNADFNGADSFTFTANDGTASSPAATVSITVNAVNDAPVANPQAVATDEDTPLVVTLTGGDVDGDGLTFAIASGPANGSLSAITPVDATSAQVTYTPNLNFNGPDSFTFTVNDGTATSPAGTVSITVNAVNDPPVANDDAAEIFEEAPNVAAANTVIGNVLTNDVDVDSALTVSPAVNATGSFGALVIAADGSFTYTLDDANPTVNALAPGGTLSDAFGYTASDGSLTDTAMLTITIRGADDPATPDDDAFDFIGNTQLLVDRAAVGTPHALETTAPDGIDGVLEGDVDPDGGGVIQVSNVVGCGDLSAPFDCTIAGQGTVSLDADGSFSFIPEAGDLDGTATFQYQLDGNAINMGTVTLTRHERVWYVDPNDDGGVGTSTDPFDTLDDIDDAGGAGDDDQPGDYVFVHDGTLALTAPMELEASQRLIGQGVALSIPVSLNGNPSPTLLVAAGTHPQLTNASGAAVTATEAVPAEIRGLSLQGTRAVDLLANAALSGSGTLTVANNEVRGAAAEGIRVNLAAGTTGTLELQVNANDWDVAGTHGDNAVEITRAAGTLRLGFSGNTDLITGNAAVAAVAIDGGAVANTTITSFAGNAVHQNTAGGGIAVSNALFDAVAGGGVEQVDGDNLAVGVTGDGVGGAALQLNTVQGSLFFDDLDLFGASGLTLAGTGGMTFMVTPTSPDGSGTSVIRATNGPALTASNATIDLRLDDLDSTTSAAAVALTSVGGQFRADGDASISKTTGGGTAFSIATSSVTSSYAGTLNVTSGAGVSLTGNSGAMSFSGGMTLSTGVNPAFAATGGGTVTVIDPAGADNTIVTTTGTALRVENTVIGGGDLTFRSISANGAPSGIVLNATGALGGLNVTGTGSAGSGGTIQGATGAGISLTNTANVELSFMNVQNGGDDGIRGSSVNNLDLDTVSVTSNGNAVGEVGIELTQLTGSGSMTSSTVSGSAENNMMIVNTSGTLSAFAVTGSSFTNTNMTTGDDGFRVENNGSGAMTISVTGGTFTDNKGDHFQVATSASATGSIDFTFSGNVLTTTAGNDPNVVGGGITVSPSGSADVTFTIDGNNVQQAFDEGINLNLGTASTAAASMIGTISNNIVGTAGDVDSGSESGTGINVISNGAGLTTVAITGNQVRQYANPYGILVNIKEGSSSMNATVTGNTVANPGTFAINGIRVDAGATAGDSGTLCAAVSGNSVAGSGPAADTDIRLRQRFNTTIRLPGYGGANNDTTAVNAFVAGNNAGSDVSSAHNVGGGGGGFVGGAACPMP